MSNNQSYPAPRDGQGLKLESLENRLILLSSCADALAQDHRLDWKHRKWCEAVMKGADKLIREAGN